MSSTTEQANKEAIIAFLQNNNISSDNVMDFSQKFETAYHVGESRKFYEATTVGFNVLDMAATNVLLVDINSIEFETEFKITDQSFYYDDTNETLTISSTESEKHNEAYKIVINSIYLDF